MKAWGFRQIWAVCVLAAWGCGTAPPEPPNIVLVVLDTVRADAINEQVTPNLAAFSGESTVFNNAWAVGPWTVPSHASMFTGKLPSNHQCTAQNPRLDTNMETLAEKLAASGYETAAFFSNPWLGDGGARLLRGFEVKTETKVPGFFSAGARLANGDQGGHGSVRKVTKWLSQRDDDRPFFLFVNLLEAHLPYDPPLEIRQEMFGGLNRHDWLPVAWGHKVNAGVVSLNPSDRKMVTSLYQGDVHLVDRLFGDLLRNLMDRGLGENTVFVVTSDHGENLGEHGLAEHQFSLHETLLKVPLVIHTQGCLSPGQRNDPVMLTDLFSTILDLAQVDWGPRTEVSRSLLGPVEESSERPVFAEYAGPSAGLLGLLGRLNPELDRESLAAAYRSVRVGTNRLTTNNSGHVELYDLQKDPQQLQNLADEQPETVAGLLWEIEKQFPVHWPTGGRPPVIGGETRSRLQEIGYLVDD